MEFQGSSDEWFKNFKKYLSSSNNEQIPNLLENIAVSETYDKSSNNLLHYVAKTNSTSLAVTLIKAGCDLNAQNLQNESPLTNAILSHKVEMVKVLLDAGADHRNSNFHNNSGPLHLAAEKGYLDIVKMLLEAGARVDAVNTKKRSPLVSAVATSYVDLSSNRYGTVKMLIEAGSKVNAHDSSFKTPLDHAIDFNHWDVCDLLKNSGATNEWQALSLALQNYDVTLAKQLIESGFDTNWSDEHSRTCLHRASARLLPEMVKLLLEHGARLDIGDYYQDLDPFCYCLKVCGDRFSQLMSSRFDLYCDDFCDHAIDQHVPDAVEDELKCLKLLLDYGADINRESTYGDTPIYIVIEECNHTKILQFLLNNGATFDLNDERIYEMIRGSNGSGYPAVLFKQQALLEAQNPDINASNWISKYQNDPFITLDGYHCYKKELESMKKTLVCNTTSFFHILVARDIQHYARNEEIRKMFETPLLSKRFSNYGEIMVKRFVDEVERQKSWPAAIQVLSHILKWDVNALRIVLENIVQYLDRSDLQNLIEI